MDVAPACLENYPGSLAAPGLDLETSKRLIQERLAAESAGDICGEGRSVLSYACLAESEDEALSLMQWIVEQEELRGLLRHCDSYGQHCFFYAARRGHRRLCEWLHSEQALGVDDADFAAQSALFYAARDGHNDVVNFLLDCGALVDRVDANGDTPLFYAARDGRAETCNLLIARGADAAYRNRSRRYASSIAKLMGHKELAAVLEAARRSVQGCDADVSAAGARPRRRRGAAAAAPAATTPPPAKRRRGRREEETAVAPPPGLEAAEESLAPTTADDQMSSAGSAAVPTPPLSPAAPGEQPPGGETDEAGQRRGGGRRQKRDLCCLQYRAGSSQTGAGGGGGDLWSFAPVFKVREFEAVFPDIAVWDREVPLPPVTLEGDMYRAEWHALAIELMRHLSEIDRSGLFREPVDPKKWGVPDYFEVVKKPMDFGTIKTKLEVGVEYQLIEDFMRDLDQVFSNCVLYNRLESEIGQIGVAVKEAADDYARQIGLKQMCDDEARLRTESMRIVEEIIQARERMTSEAMMPHLLDATEGDEELLFDGRPPAPESSPPPSDSAAGSLLSDGPIEQSGRVAAGPPKISASPGNPSTSPLSSPSTSAQSSGENSPAAPESSWAPPDVVTTSPIVSV